MQSTDFVWINNEFVPWDKANTHVLTHALQYGSSVFEGVRLYATPYGSILFRLDDHIDRLFYSASVFHMSLKFSKDDVKQAVIKTVRKNKITEGYVRIVFCYGYDKISVYPDGVPVNLMIAVCNWDGVVLSRPLRLKTASIIRPHPKSTDSKAKISGFYANSILAMFEVREAGYDEALMLDYNGYVAEGPFQNVFIVKNAVITTPKEGSILPGITRDCVFRIVNMFNFKVCEGIVSLDDFYNADEAFFTGTAAEIVPIGSLDNVQIGSNRVGHFTRIINEAYKKIVRGGLSEFINWLCYV